MCVCVCVCVCVWIYVILSYEYTSTYKQNHNDTIIKQTSEDFFWKICTSHFIVRVRKWLLRVLLWEGVGDRTKTSIYWPHSYGHQRCVFLVLLMLNRRPGGSAFCWVLAFSTTSCHQQVSETTEGPLGREWLSLPHLISKFSGPQLIRGLKGLLRRAFSTTSYHQLLWTPTVSLPVLTELYNSSTSTQSLEWHVWSSSSGNKCHAVQRSLSSGASIYECTIGILPCLISSAKSAHAISFDYWPLECVTSFRCITLEWHVCPGQRSKYNIYIYIHI